MSFVVSAHLLDHLPDGQRLALIAADIPGFIPVETAIPVVPPFLFWK
jgi:hypothetical protein